MANITVVEVDKAATDFNNHITTMEVNTPIKD